MDVIFAQILVSIITVIGLYIVAKVNTKSGREASSVESALKLQKRYEEMYDKLEADMDTMKVKFEKNIQDVQKEMKEMKATFEEKENYYKSEIEKRDDRNEELENKVVELESSNAEKDKIIAQFERGNLNE